MATPRLVLVEGFPGTGKSTTAQWLARALARAGRRARWVYEEEAPHPTARGYSAAGTRSITDFAAAYWARWDALVRAAAAADETVVLDAAFLQWPMLVLLRRDVATDVVIEFLVRLGDRLAPSGATMIYTPARDPERALTALGERRGTAWLLWHSTALQSTPYARARAARGTEALFTYWWMHADACDRAVAKLAMPKLVLDPAAGWTERRARVAAFVGVEADGTDPAAPGDAARYVGRYRRRGSAGDAHVTLHDGRLVLDGVLWPRIPLIPRARGVFDLEGWPYTVTFANDAAGFTVAGPTLHWGRPRIDFDRVD